MQHTLFISNFKTAFVTTLTLVYVLHSFACIWIYCGVSAVDGWHNKDFARKHTQLELDDQISKVFTSVEDTIMTTGREGVIFNLKQ